MPVHHNGFQPPISASVTHTSVARRHTDFRYATPSPAACPACDCNSPRFLNTNEVPIKTPEPTASTMPTERYCVGCEDVDVAELSAEVAVDDIVDSAEG